MIKAVQYVELTLSNIHISASLMQRIEELILQIKSYLKLQQTFKVRVRC